jgi:TRAP-type C4-dicarboxylate transport system permease small subunit
MKLMKKTINFTEKLNSGLGFLSGVCIFAGALLIITEILSRQLFSKSLQITDEYTGYLMAVSSLMGLGYVEMKHAHIRMDLIDLMRSKFPGTVSAFRIFAYAAAAVFSLYLTYVGWMLFYQSYSYGSKSMQISETPLAMVQIFAPLGAFALFLQYICNLYKYCASLSARGGERH